MNSESPAALLPGSFVILHSEGDLPGGGWPSALPCRKWRATNDTEQRAAAR